MLKTISTILLSFICFASLCIGIMFSACPVIPYVKYYEDYDEKPWLNSNYASVVVFNPFGVVKEIGLKRRSLTSQIVEEDTFDIHLYHVDSGGLSIPDRRIDDYTIRNLKTEIVSTNGNIRWKAKFNPTIIFYIVSIGTFIGIIAINIPKKKRKPINRKW